jgi:hypothetical protein
VLIGPPSVGCQTAQTPTNSDVPVCEDADGGSWLCRGCATPSATWADAGTLSCPRSIDAYCFPSSPATAAASPACWPARWSDLVSYAQTTGSPYFECSGFNLAYGTYGCGLTDVAFVYDNATGELTSVIEAAIGGALENSETCLAGAGSAPFLDARGCTEVYCIPTDAQPQCMYSCVDPDSGACAALHTGDPASDAPSQ